MLSRNLWKILLSVAIAAWALSELVPLNNIPFPDYVRAHITAKPDEFNKLLTEATGRVKAGTAQSEFVALQQIGRERKIDLTQYFPDINLESALTNVTKRNDILLTELLRRSRARLQRGLDLQGGVSVTLEVDPVAAAKFTEDVRQEKLTKAIDILHERINKFGVAEPIIRPVGTTRIEVQLPGLDTKTNPQVINDVKKPATLSFHQVHPTLTPQMSPNGEIPSQYEVMTLDNEDRGGESTTEELFVKRIPEMTGEALSNARAVPDLYGKPEIHMQ